MIHHSETPQGIRQEVTEEIEDAIEEICGKLRSLLSTGEVEQSSINDLHRYFKYFDESIMCKYSISDVTEDYATT